MEFQSTRSKYKVSDTKAVLMGIAPDGGLFVDPEIGAHNFELETSLAITDKDCFEPKINRKIIKLKVSK